MPAPSRAAEQVGDTMSSGITLMITGITLVGLFASLIVFELIDQRHVK
jgi:hypothetical protein